MERQGIVVDVEGDEVDFYDRLLWELRQAVASRTNYVERPVVTALAAISALSKISKSIRPGYAIPDGEPKGVLFYQTFSLGEIGARLALEEIGLPDVPEGQINATPIEEKKPSRRGGHNKKQVNATPTQAKKPSRRGGHNKKWYPLAEPYLTEHSEMSRYAIAKMVLAEGHEGDECAILRAIRNELGKQGQG